MSKHRRRRDRRRAEHALVSRPKRTVLAGTGLSIGAALGMTAPADAADFTVSNLNDSGPGSLRQAILDANATPGADRVLFQSTLTGQVTLGSELSITDATEVLGPGPDKLTISGNNNSRVFNVDLTPGPVKPVTISGLKITGGNDIGGSGIASKYADLTVANAVISQNTGEFEGGGIWATESPLTVRSSTVSGNSVKFGGGGIAHRAGSLATGLTVESSTIAGNSSTVNTGGGINSFGYSTSQLSIRNSTISGNSTGDEMRGGGGIYLYGGSSRAMVNTIVADNTAPVAPDIKTGMNSGLNASFSLVENPTGGEITGGPNIFNQDPRLLPLADNGGPTPTQALNLGSPAIDQGQATGVDQRGAPRPFDLAGVALAGDNEADIGAYERVLCGKALVNEIGTAGVDRISGSTGPDGILGFGGNDRLTGLAGGDGLCGGPGNDKLKGGNGKDQLLGEGGKDKIKGGNGKDLLKGGPGRDTLIGGKGKDKLKGGKGKDKEKQ